MKNATLSSDIAGAVAAPAPRMTLRDFLAVYRPAVLAEDAAGCSHTRALLAALAGWLDTEEKRAPGRRSVARPDGERTFDVLLLLRGLDRLIADQGNSLGLDSPGSEPAPTAQLLDVVNWMELDLEEALRTGRGAPEQMAGLRAGIAWGDARLLQDGVHRPAALGWGPRLSEQQAA